MPENLLPFFLFALSSTLTPGPNNVMLLASGTNFGLRATGPHMLGVSIGFPVMVAAVGLGLGAVFESLPILHEILRWAGSAYLLWLAWRIATAAGMGTAKSRGKPFTFLQAAGFQWINPKAWIMAVSAFSVYSAPDADPVPQALMFGVIFCAVAFPSCGMWVAFGSAMRRFLKSATALRIFNGAMATLLVASVALLFM
jgi:threonine/homoserine/homoserine lactone efflux protein